MDVRIGGVMCDKEIEDKENDRVNLLIGGKVVSSFNLSHGEVRVTFTDGTIIRTGDHYDEGGFYFLVEAPCL